MTPDRREGGTYWSLKLRCDALPEDQADGEKPKQTQTRSISYSPVQGMLYPARYGEQALTTVFTLIFPSILSVHVASDNLGAVFKAWPTEKREEEKHAGKGKWRH